MYCSGSGWQFKTMYCSANLLKKIVFWYTFEYNADILVLIFCTAWWVDLLIRIKLFSTVYTEFPHESFSSCVPMNTFSISKIFSSVKNSVWFAARNS